MAQLDFWYDFASTYSYLAASRCRTLAEAEGVSLRWRPFLLGPIFAAQGWTTSPFNLYRRQGTQHVARHGASLCGARLALAAAKPLPAKFAARGAACCGRAGRFAARLSASPFFARNSARAGPCPTKASCRKFSPASACRRRNFCKKPNPIPFARFLREETETAQKLGLFGAPTFVTPDGEIFWGDDRLEQALNWAKGAASQ